jgi:Protein of unknown function (DUF4089)
MRRKTKRKPTRKNKSIRTNRAVKRAVKVFRPRRAAAGAQRGDFIDGLMAASAEALGLSIDPAWRDSVNFNLRLVLGHAARVEAFLLPDDAEPAPVFHA